jgi:serine/threonine-protein kinase
MMSTQAPCPAPEQLKKLLDGRASEKEQAELADHLESCAACRKQLDDLTSREAWAKAARHLRQQPQPDAALRHAINELKGQPGRKDAEDDELSLDFLSPSDNPEHLGRLGRYEVLQVVGRGGMGIVLKAVDPSLQRVVAIKVLAPYLAMSGNARRRFTREAQAAAAVTYEHVVTIHAVEETNGLPYLVMQYIDGQSLQERLDRDGPPEVKEILRIGMQAASGLAAAHAQGLVHRDIKPANILLENGIQRVKLTDFGLARAVDDAAALTQSGMVAGTPEYMAPEQARGEAVDHRADLFSLGSVLYAMCTGRPPFRATTALAVLRRVSDDQPRPIKQINPDVPDWLIAVITKLHAKDPAARFQSAAEVAELLGQYLARVQQAIWTSPPTLPPGEPAKAGGPLTSVTICPTCACHLHVPEKFVGRIVNCPQCGKPFQVEEGESEIEVVRPAPPPAAPPKRKVPAHLWVLGFLVVPFTFLMCCGGGPLLVYSFFRARLQEQESAIPSPVPGTVKTLTAPPAPPGIGYPMKMEIREIPALTDKAAAQLRGRWRLVELSQDGKKVPREYMHDLYCTFYNEQYSLAGPQGSDQGTYRIDPHHQPNWIDLQPSRLVHSRAPEDRGGFNVLFATGDELAPGKVWPGIVERKEDDLNLYLGAPGKERPTKFPNFPALFYRLYHFRREAP